MEEARITLVCGPMFAGKSARLQNTLEIYSISGRKCLIIKHSKDDRFPLRAISRSRPEVKEEIPVIKASDLFEIDKTILSKFSVIGIDEGQFFRNLSEFCEEMANSGKIIIVSALNSNFKREKFPEVTELFHKCEKIKTLSSICFVCKKKAHFTKRITEETELEVIGGEDKYIPVCRTHFNNE